MIVWNDPVNRAEDGDRLIQDVLSELGWDANPKKIAENVRQLDLGLPAEDEFIAVSSGLSHALLDVEIVGAASRLISPGFRVKLGKDILLVAVQGRPR